MLENIVPHWLTGQELGVPPGPELTGSTGIDCAWLWEDWSPARGGQDHLFIDHWNYYDCQAYIVQTSAQQISAELWKHI